MKFSAFLFCLSLLFAAPSFAQKEAAIWYFGINAGLDFNSGSPVALTNGKLSTAEGCASISDKNGNLLFYTDGSVVYDKSHQLMQNGFGLLGHNSSTQSAIIVPKPNNPNLYYIFTVDEPHPNNADDNPLNNIDPPNNGLNYSLVDLRLNNGLGAISSEEKNVHLITYNKDNEEEVKFKCSEKITAIQHGDGVSFWVITHFKNNFYAFKISSTGVEQKPVKTTFSSNISTGGYNSNAIGYLKASPNGKKIAMANASTRSSNELGPKNNIIRNTGTVLLYDFNSTTGSLANEMKLLGNSNPYGLEFSAKSKKLYITTNNFNSESVITGSSLLQYDLKSSNIATSNKTINTSLYVAGGLQLGIDEKIYRATYPILSEGTTKLSVINNPESDGTNCNYMQNSIDLKAKITKLGLPPFITSLFLYSFNYEFNCLGQTTHFYINSVETIDSVLWEFGDGTSSTDREAYHTYARAGDYKVILTKTVNGETRDPLEKVITIYDAPKVLSTPYKLTQCDTQDANPTDGISTFNLALANEGICLGEKNFEVYYYHSISDAENDIYNTQSIPNIYKNNTPDELLHAKITQPNSSCYSLGSVILHANKNISIIPEPMHACDLGDGTAAFNLATKTQLIKTDLNLPTDVRLYFYPTENDSALGKNELSDEFISVAKTIYIRAENDEGCYGTGKLELLVETTPQINVLENRIICEGDINPIVTLQPEIISPFSINDFTYTWSTGENTPSISINKEGDYTVVVKNKSDCSTTINFNVDVSRLARINDIIIHDLKPENQVTIDVVNPDDYKYMIQFQNGTSTTFQNSPFFENVPGGIHELVIENTNGCGQIIKEIIVLQAPNYFTPNGDGYNDYWNIKGINANLDLSTTIYIFDRYGKLLKQLSPSDPLGWNGIFNGVPLPSDDYWFTVKLANGRKSNGHFTLKR
ncbi:T9SS type B sorting domain-containing protein [Flavobacterium granuli]|uniref:Gliding motility-associated C-terminal domain-containing protein n=1 Tax=Flavobacterium granuli TaxID=280093 RepID=A0A1M5SRB7_9FLAO|nr:T9SS type B sorting domain-containing protein [Flavobacterium granuli]PRZ21087.1 gliding motility-associated-like protein [Flavobacterium granuli]SHH40990.1 gliding motility-associated C-terminal domain-containing protein [Flavobacterium granuli]